jgi:hypothetical protein
VAGFSLLHRGIVAPMPVALDQTRREWEQGNARFQRELRETQRPDAMRAELDAVTAALRRRIGQSFSLSELADLYATADGWAREAVAETKPASGWPGRLATATEAAFHLYSRGAVDFEP